MKKQRILSALLALCIVFTLVPTALAAKADDFTDVSRSDWFYDYVDYVTSKGYFRGTSETTFSPQRNMTRAMFVVVLFRFDGAKGDSSQSAFTDVAPGAWCTAAINWAAANKIVEGKGDGTFAPNAPITRAQMCAIIDRYLNYYKKDNKVTLSQTGSVSAMSDQNTVPSYAVDAIKQSQRYGLINGFKDGTFRPNALSTRAHVAAVIYRMADLVKNAKAENTSGGGSSGGGGGSSSTTYTYTLTYDANGGVLTGASSATKTTKETSYTFKVTDAIPTRDGYTFLGWAKEKDATTATFGAGDDYTMTSANTSKTLYAVWQAKGTVINPKDHIGKAVCDSIDQVNARFTKMKSAVISVIDKVNSESIHLEPAQLQKVKDAVNAMVKIDNVSKDFPSDDMATRKVIWNVALNVKEGQAVSVIEQASKIANALVSGSAPSQPTPDIDGFLASVKNAVLQETGIDLTDKSLSEIKTQVVDKLKTEGKSLWANFHDGEGNYVCSDVKVDFNGTTATIKVDAGNTTLEGSKSQIAKELSTAISKEIYAQMKAQGTTYTDNFTFAINLDVNFGRSANEKIAQETDGFTRKYQVVVKAALDSDGLLEYKYDEGNYLRLNVTQDIQTAYNNGLQKIAEQFAWNDGEARDKVIAEAKKGIKTEIPTLYNEVKTALDKYGITLTHTTAQSLEDALLPEVESWVEANWTTIFNSTTSGGTLTGLDNNLLINAVWPLIEKDIDALNVDTLLQDQISEKLTEKGIDEAWIVNKANSSDTLKKAKNGLNMFDTVTFEPAGVTLDIQSVADINFLLAQSVIGYRATMSGLVFTGELKGTDGAPISDAFKREIVTTATKELDSALTSSTTLQDLLAGNPDLKDYLIYSALVKMGLNFDTEKSGKATALDSLKPTIKTEGKAKLEAKLNDKLSAIDVSAILNDGSAEKADAQKKINLLKGMKFDATNGIQTKTANELASALKSATMMNIVGDKGNTYVDQYLEKIVNKVQTLLPDSASVTLNGVKLDESALDAFRSATTTKDAVIALADLIAQFGDLSINSFADPAGQVLTVSYNGRTASAHLVINVK